MQHGFGVGFQTTMKEVQHKTISIVKQLATASVLTFLSRLIASESNERQLRAYGNKMRKYKFKFSCMHGYFKKKWCQTLDLARMKNRNDVTACIFYLHAPCLCDHDFTTYSVLSHLFLQLTILCNAVIVCL